MNLIKRLLKWHEHEWGRIVNTDGKLTQTCYACSKTRAVIVNLIPEP